MPQRADVENVAGHVVATAVARGLGNCEWGKPAAGSRQKATGSARPQTNCLPRSPRDLISSPRPTKPSSRPAAVAASLAAATMA